MLLVSCHEVRCREDLNMSIKICVCVDRDGVQMILPVALQKTCLQLWVCLKIELKTIELGLEAVHSSL